MHNNFNLVEYTIVWKSIYSLINSHSMLSQAKTLLHFLKKNIMKILPAKNCFCSVFQWLINISKLIRITVNHLTRKLHDLRFYIKLLNYTICPSKFKPSEEIGKNDDPIRAFYL